jgi:hypothetical protein
MNSPLLDVFLQEECDEFTRNLLLDEIEKQRQNSICEKREFEFNVFNIEIDFVKQIVKVEDDLDASDESTVAITLDKFCDLLKSLKKG